MSDTPIGPLQWILAILRKNRSGYAVCSDYSTRSGDRLKRAWARVPLARARLTSVASECGCAQRIFRRDSAEPPLGETARDRHFQACSSSAENRRQRRLPSLRRVNPSVEPPVTKHLEVTDHLGKRHAGLIVLLSGAEMGAPRRLS